MDVEIAVVGGLLDRGVEVEFVRRAGAGEFAQAPQRDLDVADAELDIASRSLNSRLSQTLTARLLRFFSWPIRTPSGCSRGRRTRGSGRADPLVAALVPALLLLEALAQVS